MSREVLSGLVIVVRVTRACTVEAVILMDSDVEKEEEVVVGGEAVQELSSFCKVVYPILATGAKLREIGSKCSPLLQEGWSILLHPAAWEGSGVGAW